MIAGTTGSRHGREKEIGYVFGRWLVHNGVTELHHGDCLGWDEEAFKIAAMLGIKTVAHPCDLREHRAYTQSTVVLPIKRPLVRNRAIVDAAEVVFAAPTSQTEVLRSGTWATIRYAREKGKPVSVL